MRLVGIKVSFGLEKAAYVFAGYLFVAVTAAYLCGAYVKRLWRSLILFLPIVIGLFALYEWGVVQIDDFRLRGKPTLLQAISNDQEYGYFAPTIVGIRIRQYYLLASVQATLVASLVFCSMRYCLACGWRPIANRSPAV